MGYTDLTIYEKQSSIGGLSSLEVTIHKNYLDSFFKFRLLLDSTISIAVQRRRIRSRSDA